MPPVVALQNARAVLTGALPKRSGGTLLHAAAADGSYAVLARLMRVLEESEGEAAVREAGRRSDAEGRTPLHAATEVERGDIIALLVEEGGATHAVHYNWGVALRLGSAAVDLPSNSPCILRTPRSC